MKLVKILKLQVLPSQFLNILGFLYLGFWFTIEILTSKFIGYFYFILLVLGRFHVDYMLKLLEVYIDKMYLNVMVIHSDLMPGI